MPLKQEDDVANRKSRGKRPESEDLKAVADRVQNAKDDELIQTLQATLRTFGIDLHHPCPGTLADLTDGIVGEQLFKAECLVADNRMVMAFWDTYLFPAERTEELRNSAEQRSESPECYENGKRWLRLATGKGPFSFASFAVIAEVFPDEDGRFSVEGCSRYTKRMLEFARANWPERRP